MKNLFIFIAFSFCMGTYAAIEECNFYLHLKGTEAEIFSPSRLKRLSSLRANDVRGTLAKFTKLMLNSQSMNKASITEVFSKKKMLTSLLFTENIEQADISKFKFIASTIQSYLDMEKKLETLKAFVKTEQNGDRSLVFFGKSNSPVVKKTGVLFSAGVNALFYIFDEDLAYKLANSRLRKIIKKNPDNILEINFEVFATPELDDRFVLKTMESSGYKEVQFIDYFDVILSDQKEKLTASEIENVSDFFKVVFRYIESKNKLQHFLDQIMKSDYL